MLLVVSSVWIDWLKDPYSSVGRSMASLLANGQVVPVEVVLSEILQGARAGRTSSEFSSRMTTLDYRDADNQAYIREALTLLRFRCQKHHIALPGALFADIAKKHSMAVCTVDSDLKCIPDLKLYRPNSA